MVCTAGSSGVRRPPWEVLPSRRPIVQRPSADCEDDPEPGTRTSERRALHNDPRLDDTIRPGKSGSPGAAAEGGLRLSDKVRYEKSPAARDRLSRDIRARRTTGKSRAQNSMRVGSQSDLRR